jgi:hypothetical protein
MSKQNKGSTAEEIAKLVQEYNEQYEVMTTFTFAHLNTKEQTFTDSETAYIQKTRSVSAERKGKKMAVKLSFDEKGKDEEKTAWNLVERYLEEEDGKLDKTHYPVLLLLITPITREKKKTIQFIQMSKLERVEGDDGIDTISFSITNDCVRLVDR